MSGESQLQVVSVRKARHGPIAFREPKLSLAEGPISKLPPLNTCTLLSEAIDVLDAAAADDGDPALIVAASPCISICTYKPSSADCRVKTRGGKAAANALAWPADTRSFGSRSQVMM
jgi:hypothetical protein